MQYLAAQVTPHVLENLQAQAQGVSEVETALDLEGVKSLPAIKRVGGAEKVVEVPLEVFAAPATEAAEKVAEAVAAATDAADRAEHIADAVDDVLAEIQSSADRIQTALNDVGGATSSAQEAGEAALAAAQSASEAAGLASQKAADAEAAAEHAEAAAEAAGSVAADVNSIKNQVAQSLTDVESAVSQAETAVGSVQATIDGAVEAAGHATSAGNVAAGAAADALAAADGANEQAGVAAAAAAVALDAARHQPYIGEGGYVYKWNPEAEEYERTDVCLQGETGADGKSLRVLPNGRIAYWDTDSAEWVDSGVDAAADVDIEGTAVAFAEAENRALPESGDTIPAVFGKLLRWLRGLGKFAFASTIDWLTDVTNKPEITPKAYIDAADAALAGHIEAEASRLDGRINASGSTLGGQIESEAARLDGRVNAASAALAATNTELTEVRAIAEGASKGLVFETKAQLDQWLTGEYVREDGATPADLVEGQHLLLKELDVPDYWWTGVEISELETDKVDLTGYATDAGVDAKLAGKANADEVLHLSGVETVTGAKTFTAPPVVPEPTADDHAVPKSYVVHLAGAQTVAGRKTFSAAPRTQKDPEHNNDLTRMSWVLKQMEGLDAIAEYLDYATGVTEWDGTGGIPVDKKMIRCRRVAPVYALSMSIRDSNQIPIGRECLLVFTNGSGSSVNLQWTAGSLEAVGSIPASVSNGRGFAIRFTKIGSNRWFADVLTTTMRDPLDW